MEHAISQHNIARMYEGGVPLGAAERPYER